MIIYLLLFSHSTVYDSMQPHALQYTRLPCPPSPGACSNSCPLSWWCHPTISSFVIPFFSCFQSYPASGSFPVIQFFTSGGQSIGASASASVPPMNIHNWFPSGLFGLIFSNSSYSQESSPIPQFKSFNSSILSLLCLCICLYCFSPDQSKISCFFSYLGRHLRFLSVCQYSFHLLYLSSFLSSFLCLSAFWDVSLHCSEGPVCLGRSFLSSAASPLTFSKIRMCIWGIPWVPGEGERGKESL